ncbi:MAG: molecular chaperone HtpG [Firmicutes bacterium]|nr:molecular chaperone HtpG [Bacillota bacterium]
MKMEKGNLSINSENFLPIIKKWLYTDKDIFVRELVSNSCDAVSKFKKLVSLGEATADEKENYKIDVFVDAPKGTITISDNGIGMTEEEIKKYINQIAFSGATDFIAKYEEKMTEGNDIIGHFGLGFYSAFMVADRVEIDSLSYQEGSKAAHWTCDGGIEYEMGEGERTSRGTTITLHVGEDGKEFLDSVLMYSTLRKYCAFMPVQIYFEYEEIKEEKTEEELAKEAEIKAKADAEAKAEAPELGTDDLPEEDNNRVPVAINETQPLWVKNPKDVTDEEYKKFYHDVFRDSDDPLFYIHLNMDYPFNLKGILYFPRLLNDANIIEGEVKLYSNQVYIADNIKEVVPEFLLLLKGVMDCPDLPLNVSRSALQNDGYVTKMNTYITKKVADKLNSIFKNDRSQYENFWNDISLFIKYGCMKDDKFYDKIKDSLIYKTTNGDYKTLEEYLEANKDKHENKVIYVSDEKVQVQYVNMLKEQGMEAILLSAPIDVNFISFLEYKALGRISFARVDADINETLKDTTAVKDEVLADEMQTLFRMTLGKDDLKVESESLKSSSVSAMMLLSEESRRMMELAEMYKQVQPEMAAMFADAKPEYTLILNQNNSLVKKLGKIKNDASKTELTELICRQLYDLALMSQKSLEPSEMSAFIARSNTIMEKMLED